MRGSDKSKFAPVLDRNIRAICRRRDEEAHAASWQERIADGLARFSGRMQFVYIHIVFFGLWIAANLGWLPGVPIWDPSFAVLAMVASVEAIFLSTFVLMTQNRMAAAADNRADLDLQISLLAEHEITRLAKMIAAISERLGVTIEDPREGDPEGRRSRSGARPALSSRGAVRMKAGLMRHGGGTAASSIVQRDRAGPDGELTMLERQILTVTVVEGQDGSGKQVYGIHIDYEDGTNEDVLVGELREAQKAAQQSVEIGEAYVRKLVEDTAARPARVPVN